MKRRRPVLLAVGSLIAASAVLFAAALVTLRSPALLARLAGLLGYDLHVEAVALSPSLSGSLAGLRIERRGDGLVLSASRVTAQNTFPQVLRGEIDRLVLESLTLSYRLGTGGGGALDLSFLARLPSVRHLELRNARLVLTREGDPGRLELTGVGLTLKDYTPATGGTLAFSGAFAVTTGGAPTASARGRVTANVRLGKATPVPSGRGTVELAVETGTYAIDGRTVSLSGLALTAEAAYDPGSGTLTLAALRGESRSLGRFTAAGRAVLRGDVPWNASVAGTGIDFAQVLTLARPLLPETYRGWTVAGQGDLETELRGTYAGQRLRLDGTLTFSFSRAGVSSPDGSTAAQALGGTVVMRLWYAAPDRRLGFDLRSEHRAGEYLWGAYYNDLTGQRASFVGRGAVSWADARRVELAGQLDLFQSGTYAIAGTGVDDEWVVRVTAADVSHARLVELVRPEALAALAPGLRGLALTGTSALEGELRLGPAGARMAGTFTMTGATLTLPAAPLRIEGMEAHVPFALGDPGRPRPPAARAAPGALRLASLHAGDVVIDDLTVPLRVAGNAVELPEPLVIPLLGGLVRVAGVRVDDVLSAAHARAGVAVHGLDVARLTTALGAAAYPGRIDGDLGVVTYRAGRLAATGRVVARVFGGEVEATGLFAERLWTARRVGADVWFRGIRLEEATRRLAVGRMSGVIEGSLRDFVMEYGQPASATLDLRSVPTPGADQWISVDAIQNISILGTGASTALDRGIAQFFREYPYRRIGVVCVLRNDQFSVRGTIVEGGTEYLVRRGFLRGVDVVNQNPNNVISFRDMRERLQRIYRKPAPAAGAVTH